MDLLQLPFYQEITFSGMEEQILGFDIDSDLTWIIQVGTSLRFVFVNLIFLETFVESQPSVIVRMSDIMYLFIALEEVGMVPMPRPEMKLFNWVWLLGFLRLTLSC